MKLIIIAVILLALLVTVLIARDCNRFVIVTYHIKTGVLKEPVKTVFVSDLHDKQYGPSNEKLLSAIDRIAPKLIFVGGDLLTAHPGNEVGKSLAFIRELTARGPVFYGSGNHEQRLKLYPETYGDMSRQLEEGLQEAGVIRLVNEEKAAEDLPLSISSVEIPRRFYKRGRLREMTKDDMTALLQPSEKEGRYRILLAHNPDYFDAYKKWGADLVLSGHIHGGLVRLPFLGGVVSPRICFFPKYDGGRFDEDGKTMIVSRGLGFHTLPIRLFNPGELIEIILE
ncbi:MAG: metallophosphoesterase [Lachnospiraceae bacterium]|nr:metallophosphoesterase [Lachnospiraceae bacterium]